MTTYGMEVYDSASKLIFSSSDRIARVFWWKTIEAAGELVIPGIYIYGAPTLYTAALMNFTPEDWSARVQGEAIPSSAHTVTHQRIGNNVFIRWRKNPFEGMTGCEPENPTRSTLVLFGY